MTGFRGQGFDDRSRKSFVPERGNMSIVARPINSITSGDGRGRAIELKARLPRLAEPNRLAGRRRRFSGDCLSCGFPGFKHWSNPFFLAEPADE